MSLVEIEEFEKVSVRIVLKDPENLNAMSEKMADDFLSAIDTLKSRTGLRAVVITGAGKAFSAGGDLQMLKNKSMKAPHENQRSMRRFYHSFLSILELNVPLIAMINGHAVGAGLCLASACDIRVCSEDAKLGFTFTKLGLHPGMGATYFLPRILGQSKAAELLYSGKLIDAKEAHSVGLVTHISEPKKLEDYCRKLVLDILDCGPLSISLLSQTLHFRYNEELKVVLESEAINQAYSYASKEFHEGVQAAIEKRKAQFVNKI